MAKLEERFSRNVPRHRGIAWKDVAARLAKSPAKLWSLGEMERTGGEPDGNELQMPANHW